MHFIEKIKDWLLEREIRRHQNAFVRDPSGATYEPFRAAICRRSARQVARMERERGLI
jgi:hypothetical protein